MSKTFSDNSEKAQGGISRLLNALGDLTRIACPQQTQDQEDYGRRLKLLCEQIRNTVGADLTCLMNIESRGDGSRIANFQFASGYMAEAILGHHSQIGSSERNHLMPEALEGLGFHSSRAYKLADDHSFGSWLGVFWTTPPNLLQDSEEFLRSAAQLVRAEVRLRDADESRRWLATRLDQEKKAHAIAREQLDRQLKAEQLFRTIGNTIPFGVFVTDASGFPNYVSSSFLALIGMSIDDYRRFKWKDLIHPEQRENVVKSWLNAVRTGANWNCEYQIYSHEGKLHTIMGRASPFFDSAGRTIGFAGVNFDITDRKIAEDRLKRSEERYRQIVDVANEGIWKMDIFGKTKFTNRSLSTILGYTEDEFKKLNIWDKIDHDCLDQFHDAWHKLQKSERQQLDCAFVCKGGEKIWVYLSLSPIRNELGAVDGVLALVTDVTQRHHFEDELKAAKAAADAASQAKSQFLANMSHEIRTPLTAVLGFGELLLDEEQTAEDRKLCVDAIRRNGRLLLNLINDILDLSKVEAGKLDIEPLPFSVRDLANELASTFRPQADTKSLNLDVSVDDSVPERICSDPTRVRQILINIVGNAFKFTSKGKIAVRFSREKRYLVIVVSDTGSGIPPADARRLFAPFTQADSSITRKFGGTGLGLILSRNLARSLSGDVALIHSRPGEGTSFEIRLPMDLPCRNSESKLSKVEDVTSDFAQENFEGLRILVVDDSPDNRLLMRRLLEPYGVQIAVANNGKDGVEKALNDGFDCVFMDIQMPILDGYEATIRLRNSGFDRPIIALTAHAMKQEREKALKVGFTAHLPKPLNKQALLNTIRDCLQSARAAAR